MATAVRAFYVGFNLILTAPEVCAVHETVGREGTFWLADPQLIDCLRQECPACRLRQPLDPAAFILLGNIYGFCHPAVIVGQGDCPAEGRQ
jgi:hypothetical protein